MSYCNLREKSRYLKEIEKGANRSLREDEIATCEERADAYIEGRLGKTWDTAPTIIEEIADLLSSARAWNFLHSGQSNEACEFSNSLQTEAEKMLTQIVAGILGIRLLSGAWDEEYPGEKNSESKTKEGQLEILV